MRARHGTAASLSGKSNLRELFDHGFLLRVFRDGTWVAGALCEFRCGGLRLCALGVLQSDMTLIQQGVMGTIYVGVIQAANNMKCGKLDLTVSAPFFSDGLFSTQKKLGDFCFPMCLGARAHLGPVPAVHARYTWILKDESDDHSRQAWKDGGPDRS